MKPNYFLIPEIVVANKEINALDKFVYGAVYWYSQMADGKCIASNEAIAKIVYSTGATVQQCLTRLEKYGFIQRVYSDESRQKRAEIVPLVAYPQLVGVDKSQLVPPIATAIQSSKSDREANIILTYNVSELPKNYGSTGIKRVASIYNIFWRDKFGMNYKVLSWGKFGKLVKSLLSQYTEYQIALLFSVYFQTQDTSEYKFLSEKGFPLEFLLTKHNIYSAYITNALGINMGDKQKVKEYVDSIIKNLGTI